MIMGQPQESLSTADLARPQPTGAPDTETGPNRSEASDAGSPPGAGSSDGHQPLLAAEEGASLRQRWDAIQASFVDEPRTSVEQADGLVADVMQRLAAMFNDERVSLESQWERGEDVSTEDLRVALQRYRSFFDRLLAA
jgi:hypothetical protein